MRLIIRRNGILLSFRRWIPSVQNCIAILTQPTVYKTIDWYFILTTGRRSSVIFTDFYYFLFFAVLDMDWRLSKWWPPTSPLSFFEQIYSYIRPFPLLSTISVLSFSPLRKWWCLYTKSVTPYSILLSAIQHPHRLSTHSFFPLSLPIIFHQRQFLCEEKTLIFHSDSDSDFHYFSAIFPFWWWAITHNKQNHRGRKKKKPHATPASWLIDSSLFLSLSLSLSFIPSGTSIAATRILSSASLHCLRFRLNFYGHTPCTLNLQGVLFDFFTTSHQWFKPAEWPSESQIRPLPAPRGDLLWVFVLNRTEKPLSPLRRRKRPSIACGIAWACASC